MENTIAVVSDPLFARHLAPDGAGHPERPERLDAAREATFASFSSGFSTIPSRSRLLELPPRDATEDELGRVHTPRYVEELSKTAGRRGYLDADTFYSQDSFSAATRAAGGCVAMVDALMGGEASYGVALVRPPGHHARPGGAMGFCLLNNIAIAAAHARARGAQRVAVVDWDVHHGNGTQEMFYEDPAVLYVSLHQWPLYPGTGAREERGAGDGRGATLNIPLSAGAGDAAYDAAVERIVAPALAAFDADLLLISAGFDAHERDPLAGMSLTESGYAKMTHRLLGAMPRGGRGRLGIVLEGGYDLTALRQSLMATLGAVEGRMPDPSAPSVPIAPRHDAELRLAEAAHVRSGPAK